MENIRLGILGTSEIAFRRFLPALQKCEGVSYAGVASRTVERTAPFVNAFGGRGYSSYQELLEDLDIESVYVPLPPALHFEWGKRVLLAGKHLFMEKPFTTNPEDTQALLQLARQKGLAVHENYMFLYHSQLAWIEEQVKAGVIGELRLIRAAFGFPKRGEADFRYSKSLGGGALLDCGGYPLRLVSHLLGETARVTAARLNQPSGYEVDLFGCATVENEIGQAAQISFGMDNSYKCELELWGSRGCLMADRIFTAPAGFTPVITLHITQGTENITLEADDSFRNSIRRFQESIEMPNLCMKRMEEIRREAQLVETLCTLGGK